ncbi:hypothetical protein A20C1_08288 [marine actinobacterium PHSC20C1]|nr:hypothetical protein A20C1_08288 [marine actinobacterium PHSC20C1]
MNNAGDTGTVGQSIPVPNVRAGQFEWAQRRWANQATVWPKSPPRFAPLTVMTHVLFALFLLVALAGVAAYLFEYIGAPVADLSRQLVLGAIAADLVLVVIAVTLCRVNIATGLARILFLFFAVTAILGLAYGGVVLALNNNLASEFTTIPYLANLPLLIAGALFVVLAIVVWSRLNTQVSSFAHWRRNIMTAAQTVFPGGLRERYFAGEPLVLNENSGELERRLAVAERLSTPLLEQLLVMPGVTLVGGLELPGSRTSHVGHAVVAGSQIALIDSVLWMPGQYVLDAWGRVVRDGKIDEHINVTTAIAAQRYSADRPQLKIRSWAVVHRLADAPLTIATEPQNAVRLVTPEDLLREVGEWLAPVGEQIDTFALQFAVNSRLK